MDIDNRTERMVFWKFMKSPTEDSILHCVDPLSAFFIFGKNVIEIFKLEDLVWSHFLRKIVKRKRFLAEIRDLLFHWVWRGHYCITASRSRKALHLNVQFRYFCSNLLNFFGCPLTGIVLIAADQNILQLSPNILEASHVFAYLLFSMAAVFDDRRSYRWFEGIGTVRNFHYLQQIFILAYEIDEGPWNRIDCAWLGFLPNIESSTFRIDTLKLYLFIMKIEESMLGNFSQPTWSR